MGANLQQRQGGVNHGFLDERSLGGVLPRENETTARAYRAVSHRQRSPDGAQISRQGEFASPFVFIEFIPGDLTRRRQDAQGNWQVEASALLGQVGWSKVYRDATGRKFKLRILQRRPYPILAFLHLRFGQAYDSKTGQPIGNMSFHRYQRRIHA